MMSSDHNRVVERLASVRTRRPKLRSSNSDADQFAQHGLQNWFGYTICVGHRRFLAERFTVAINLMHMKSHPAQRSLIVRLAMKNIASRPKDSPWMSACIAAATQGLVLLLEA